MRLKIIYDGHCHLCVNAIRLLENKNQKRKMLFIPFQSRESQGYLDGVESIDELVVVKDGKVYKGARAVSVLLQELGGVYKLVSILLKVLPMSLKNWLYKKIASNRYRIWGKRKTCYSI